MEKKIVKGLLFGITAGILWALGSQAFVIGVIAFILYLMPFEID